MKYNELKNKNAKDLKEKDLELRDELFHLRIKHKTAQLEDKSKIRLARRDIARIQTKLSELSRKES